MTLHATSALFHQPPARRLSRAEEHSLAERIRSAEESGDIDMADQLRWTLAMSGREVARMEARKLASTPTLEEELLQEGYLGLLKAARRFDPDRGVRFNSYARWWVRATLFRFVECTNHVVYTSSSALEQSRKLRKFRDSLEASGADASAETLAELTGIPLQRVHGLLMPARAVSLDAPRDSAHYTIAEVLPDDSESADALLAGAQALQNLRDTFVLLNDRQQTVLIRRFGLNGQSPGTLAQIGKEMSLSRESIRVIERSALDCLHAEFLFNTVS